MAPDYVFAWMEEALRKGLDLRSALYPRDNQPVARWIAEEKNQETFALAWLFAKQSVR